MTAAGARRELARYQLPSGPRVLYGQRINGHVAVSDVPAGEHGRVYLVERHVHSQDEMDALVAISACPDLTMGGKAIDVLLFAPEVVFASAGATGPG